MPAADLDPIEKKTVLRHFTYGLYAVAAAHQGERGIFTANWVSQVSFEPPLVMVSVELDSSTLPLIRASGYFTIVPFASDQQELAGALGRPRAKAGDKFEAYQLPEFVTASGAPALGAGLGFVACKVASETVAGDSVVLIGEVVEARVYRAGEPLTMKAAGFRHAG